MKGFSPRTVLDSLNLGLHQALKDNSHVVILGEDLLDPYGGAFKVTRGLSVLFPKQVIATPISEAGITGVAGGMALRGLRPVVEIMFGDFTTLAMDQIINHIAKFRGMYNERAKAPVVIRTPMGGWRGYGPTHSQSLEKMILGVPGIQVLAPFNLAGDNPIGEPGRLLHDAICKNDEPVFFVENKLQYLLTLKSSEDLAEFELETYFSSGIKNHPIYALKFKSAPPADLTLAAYGYMAHLALEAAYQLAYQDEIFCEIIIPTQLSPFDLNPLYKSVKHTGILLAIEEGSLTLGWGAEVLARTVEHSGSYLKQAGRVAAKDGVIPAALNLEAQHLPGVSDIINRVREMV